MITIILAAFTINVGSSFSVIYDRFTPAYLPKGETLRKALMGGSAGAHSTNNGTFANAGEPPPACGIEFTIKNITFDFYTDIGVYYVDGQNLIEGVKAESIMGDDGVVENAKIYRLNGGADVYILARGRIVANQDCSGMFLWFTRLEKVVFNNFDTRNTTTFAYMFSWGHIQKIEGLEKLNTDKLVDTSQMFDWCSLPQYFDMSGLKTEHVKNMSEMFDTCSGLEVLNISTFSNKSLENSSLMFASSTSLKTIYIGDDWDPEYNNIWDNTFNDVYILTGGAGTAWTRENSGGEYARLDGGPNSATPGYFTHILQKTN